MWHVWGTGEVLYTGFWWGDRREKDHLKNIASDASKMDLYVLGWGAWTGFIWLGTATGGGRL
jgi:hypothetical protein